MILAVDQGTTGTTCLAVDDELRVHGRGYAELPQHFPRAGWVEHDPEQIWASVLAAARGLEFEHALREHEKEYELIEFAGAPHSFFDRKQEEFKDASEDAWNRVLGFVEKHR